jgi:hypothetical protein
MARCDTGRKIRDETDHGLSMSPHRESQLDRRNSVPSDMTPFNGKPPALGQTLGLGRVFAASGLFADSRGAAQAAVKILAGQEMGFGPLAAMTGVNIIRGRVSLGANLIAAAIRRSPRYDYRVRRHTDSACEIEFLMDGQPIGTSLFTLEDARRAGLAHGDNWKKYPRNMLFARAISNGAKWHCPDVFGGPVYTPDELGAAVDGETGEMLSPPSNDMLEVSLTPGGDLSTGALESLLKRKGVDIARVRAHYGLEDLDSLNEAQRREVVLRLEGRPDVEPMTAGTSPDVDNNADMEK